MKDNTTPGAVVKPTLPSKTQLAALLDGTALLKRVVACRGALLLGDQNESEDTTATPAALSTMQLDYPTPLGPGNIPAT